MCVYSVILINVGSIFIFKFYNEKLSLDYIHLLPVLGTRQKCVGG
jgi:hypothetical protein